jgi:hypothetical protein
VAAAAAALPDARHVLNFCADRYRFAVLLLAAIVRRQVTLLPPATTPHVIRSMHAFAPDAYYVSDDPAIVVDLPRHAMAEGAATAPAAIEIPMAPADQRVACVFTSGSTGEPQPNFKHWGPLVDDAHAEARPRHRAAAHDLRHRAAAAHVRLRVDGAAAAVERRRAHRQTPLLPADIDAALARRAPRACSSPRPSTCARGSRATGRETRCRR